MFQKLLTNGDPLIITTPLAVDSAAPVEGAVAWLDAGLPDEGVSSTAAEQVAGACSGRATDTADTARCTCGVGSRVHFAEAWGSRK